jgi:hypothetical protein
VTDSNMTNKDIYGLLKKRINAVDLTDGQRLSDILPAKEIQDIAKSYRPSVDSDPLRMGFRHIGEPQ